MESSATCFGKLIDIINGQEYFIRQVPCAIGRISSRDYIPFKDRKAMIGRTIKLDANNYFTMNEINDFGIQNKLVIDNCKRIFSVHLILFFDHKTNEFKIKQLGGCFLNTMPQNYTESFVVKSNDQIVIDCQMCKSDHVYLILFPSITKPETVYVPNANEVTDTIQAEQEGYPVNNNKRLYDTALANSWTNHEKDCLKKYILTYGYGRWKMIKKNSGGVLNDKPDIEIKIFSNSFLKILIDLLSSEKSELRKFLISLIDEGPNDPYILPRIEDWGNVIKQKYPAWGKRIQLLFRVRLIIEKYKNERKKNKDLRRKINSPTTSPEEKEKLKAEIHKTYDHWDNLLNFLPNNVLFGQKPCMSWTKSHDIDLLRGIYKHGYANYIKMHEDSKLSFAELDNSSSFQEFPNADTITRRLKKLIQIIIKNESSEGVISFDDLGNCQEPTGFNQEEKTNILRYLINYSIPINNEGKNDWTLLRDKLAYHGLLSDENKAVSPQKVERLAHMLLEICRVVIQSKVNDNKEDLKEQIDLDKDGFDITFEEADNLLKRMNMLNFIRKNIVPNNYKLFHAGVDSLTEVTKKGMSTPAKCGEKGWNCAHHDKILISLIEDKGFDAINTISNNNSFKQVTLSPSEYLERINFICEFFRDFLLKDKKKKDPYSYANNPNTNALSSQPLKSPNMNLDQSISESNINNSSKKKPNKLNIQRDEYGNYVYPITINSSLQIFNLGVIEYERIAYHSEKNLFPIGYKALREHSSMTKLGERALYTCEILDGGLKPQYRITPEEDPENPIIKDSSTGCWMVICHKINELQKSKRQKVTISGTERFGLCEPNVIKLLRSLPNANKCAKYNMKPIDD